EPRPGDVAAYESHGNGYTGHVGIVVNDNGTLKVANADDDKVNLTTIDKFFNDKPKTYIRYVGEDEDNE
ncbi:MAG: CHAP domain-containing protein, partial [Arcobacter sp.]|nr:CHAP domain-containing protein [Arcobacter sp.]